MNLAKFSRIRDLALGVLRVMMWVSNIGCLLIGVWAILQGAMPVEDGVEILGAFALTGLGIEGLWWARKGSGIDRPKEPRQE